MLGAVVFSIIKKSNAKQRGVTGEKTSPFDPMAESDPMLDELKELFSKPKPKPQVEPISEDVIKPKLKAQQPIVKQKVPVSKPKKNLETLDVEEEEGFNFIAEEVDLRKAVIYSEILNRPYQ